MYIFYEEPDPDRWIRGDRYFRGVVRRVLRGRPSPGGMMRWFLNLKAGLDQLGVNYRVNDFTGLRNCPGAVAHVIGKPQVIDKIPARHPIVFGPAVAAHPYENDFWDRNDLRLILISCEWFSRMYRRDLPRRIPIRVWPAGIDSEHWRPPESRDWGTVAIYDKIRWRRDEYEQTLLVPISNLLRAQGLQVVHIRYGDYKEADYRDMLSKIGAMIFLCEHETQGFAYLQALSCDVPIFAWDRGGFWQDPTMYPHRVRFGPVTSVPYFDERCGSRFADFEDFEAKMRWFLDSARAGRFLPREFVRQNLNLAQQARLYLELAASATELEGSSENRTTLIK